MASKEERQRRRRLVRSWQEEERAKAEADADELLPFPRQELTHMFKYIDDGWAESGCDHTPRLALGYLTARGLNEHQRADVLEWLKAQGGACDCEILANVTERWIEAYDPEEWNYESDYSSINRGYIRQTPKE